MISYEGKIILFKQLLLLFLFHQDEKKTPLLQLFTRVLIYMTRHPFKVIHKI